MLAEAKELKPQSWVRKIKQNKEEQLWPTLKQKSMSL